MKEKQALDLAPDDKRLLNILEIKIYDISQNVEILTKQLSTNQIKDVVAQTYNIFCQLKPIFEKMGVLFLYEIMRKMQISSVLISSILTEKLDRKIQNQKNPKKQVETKLAQAIIPEQVIQEQFNNENSISAKIPKLGGINLYNQTYRRGLEYYQVDDISNIDEFAGKCHIKQSKKFRQNLMESVARDLENKTDVETDNINDQIKNFIRNYKQNNKISSCISYEKELSEIIDFFKTSELEAMDYLNKSPKNGSQYTEDYINRINDMEKEIKSKESRQKCNILEKMKMLILRMKEKMMEIEKIYEEKNQKLMKYQKSLKRQTITDGTQTNDGFEKRIKQLEAKVKETQEKYLILSELKKDEFNMQDKLYDINHQLQIKNNQIKKLTVIKDDQEEELQYLKKIIRQNKEKFTIPPDLDRKKLKVKTKLFKEMVKKTSEEHGTFKILQKVEESQTEEQKKKGHQNEMKQARQQRRTKRYEKLANHSSSGYRSSIETDVIEDLQRMQADIILQNQSSKQRSGKQDDFKKKSTFSQNPNSRERESPVYQNRETKESNFKYQSKKIKKQSESQKQVCFDANNSSQTPTPESSLRSSNQNLQMYNRAQQNSRSGTVNEDNISGDLQYQDQENERFSRKNFVKNNSKSNINSFNTSNQSLEPQQNNKSSQIFSKKRILTKEKIQIKQINAITKVNKCIKFSIGQQYNFSIELQHPITNAISTVQQKICRSERPSYPAVVSINPINIEQRKQIKITQNGRNSLKSNNIIQPNIMQPLNNDSKNKTRSNKTSFQNINKERRQSVAEEQHASNKSIKTTKEDIIIKKQVTAAPNQNITKKQKTEQPTTLVKKQKKLSKQHAQPQDSSVFQNNFKKLAACLQKVNEACIDKQSDFKQQQWRMMSDNVSEDNITIVNYIVDEIQKQNLNMAQFQQIMRVLDDDGEDIKEPNINCMKHGNISGSSSISGPDSDKSKRNTDEIKTNKVKISILKQNQTKNIKAKKSGHQDQKKSDDNCRESIYNDINGSEGESSIPYVSQYTHKKEKTQQLFKEFQSIKNMKMQGPLKTEVSAKKQYHFERRQSQSLEKILPINKQMSKKIIIQGIQYPVSKASMERIKQLHNKIGKCNSKQNSICQHIQKYMTILKRINELTVKTKQPFKLPIQRIGQHQFEKEQQPKDMQKIMMIKMKKDQLNKTSEGTMKYRLPTEQHELVKDRILPTINTTNTFYKAKNKIMR